MLSHWIVAPILLPLITGAVLVFLENREFNLVVKSSAFISSATQVILALFLILEIWDLKPQVYSLSDWVAPYGIVLVLDKFSSMMLLLSTLVALTVLIYGVSSSWDSRGKHFFSLFQFQVLGVNGAFLTGDFFNLFVFFEIMLISSYSLMIHSGGRVRMKAGIQYVVVNLFGSTLFLIAVGLIYSTVGTLNLADLAIKISEVPGDQNILRSGLLLLMLVFALKGGLVPFHFWLPATYVSAPAVVTALFAILSKVGAYSIIRFYNVALAFMDLNLWSIYPYLLVFAILTIVIGSLGVIGAQRLLSLSSFAVITSMGVLFVGIAINTELSISASLYYLVHSTLVAAVLFLLTDLVRERRLQFQDYLDAHPRFAQQSLLSLIFFIAAIAMTGLPPLSGFVGKVMILNSALVNPYWVWVWLAILLSSFLQVIGVVRAGSNIFWKPTDFPANVIDTPQLHSSYYNKSSFVPTFLMIGFLLIWLLFSHMITNKLNEIAREILNPLIYINAVLGG